MSNNLVLSLWVPSECWILTLPCPFKAADPYPQSSPWLVRVLIIQILLEERFAFYGFTQPVNAQRLQVSEGRQR